MRALVLALVAGCAATAAPVHTVETAQPLAARTAFVVGEQMVFEVFWRGVAIGRASLEVDARGVHSAFATTALARALADVRYDLRTELVAAHARSAAEDVTLAGTTTHTQLALSPTSYRLDGRPGVVPGGGALHTLHSALGVLRAWAEPGAPRGYVWLALRGALYRLDAASPVVDDSDGIAALRIDCTARALTGEQVDISVWLARTDERTPLRFVIDSGGGRIAAQLIETTAAFAAR